MGRDIFVLTENCVTFFVESYYGKSRIDNYKSLWRRGIIRYMKANNESVYTPELGQDFIRECFPETDIRPTAQDMIRSIRVLDDFLNLGYIRQRAVVPVKHLLSGEIGGHIHNFIEDLRIKRRSSATIKGYELYLSRFVFFLDKVGVSTVGMIQESHVIKFVSTTMNSKYTLVSYLRTLFDFWFENHITGIDYQEYLKNYRWTLKEKIPSYYDSKEVQLIESSVERNNHIGKRNYAILLLASRLGLRAADIANLRFDNIDWCNSEISLIQYKTGKRIKLPLLNDVGNAIIDYLKFGRPKSDSQRVFIACRSPYIDATPGTICGVIRGLMGNAKISTEGRKYGPHSLRHSLASNLLENETPMPIISGILGHQHTDTTMTYLRIDLVSLRKCTLPVSLVKEQFYTQKGGIFYE